MMPPEENGANKFIAAFEKFRKAKEAAMELSTPQEQIEALKKAVDEYLRDIGYEEKQ